MTDLQSIIKESLDDLYISYAAEVTSVDPFMVKPLFKTAYNVDFPEIESQVNTFEASGFSITFPYSAGDIVLCITAKTDIRCQLDGDTAFPVTEHDLAQSVVVCGLKSNDTVSSDGIVIKTGNSSIKLTQSTAEFGDITNPLDVIANAVAGKISLANHVHPSAVGPTGPPMPVP